MAKGSYIGQVQIGDNTYPVGSVLYGTCDTAADTAAKVVNNNNLTTSTFTNANLATGITIHIQFTYSNTAAAPALQIGAANAVPIAKYGSTPPGTTATTSWVAGAVVSFTYDGSFWVMNTGIDTDTTYTPANAAPGDITTAGSAGSSTNYARQDHTHGISVAQGTNNGELVIGGTTVSPKNISNAAYKDVSTSIPSSGTADDAKLPTVAAMKNYVSAATSSITGVMHFIGSTSTELTDGATTSTLVEKTTGSLSKTTGFIAGDVVLYNNAEFVWNGEIWEILGDEGSYALKSNTTDVGSASAWDAGSAPTLGTAFSIPNVTSAGFAPSLETEDISFSAVDAAGSVTTASVSNGTLTITQGSATTTTSKTVKAVKTWDAGAATTLGTAFSVPNVTSVGSAPSLTVTSTTVVVPGS